ncbi:hypothetical protein EIP91_006487 [Steccherinum ochraceum]|uniref:Uncharacterized protein n=1 Tax=Steccherinum ochraceum TaxID=92696 RepID=A0A4R0RLW4_9APHY|nr:hypothetical protein EIP91_006487 [Steccherinum ochraceum]
MCHWRRVRNNYKRCEHYIDLPDQMVEMLPSSDPFNADGRPDPMRRSFLQIQHLPSEELCSSTLHRNLLAVFPQQFNPVIDDFCPSCIQRGVAQSTSNASKYA